MYKSKWYHFTNKKLHYGIKIISNITFSLLNMAFLCDVHKIAAETITKYSLTVWKLITIFFFNLKYDWKNLVDLRINFIFQFVNSIVLIMYICTSRKVSGTNHATMYNFAKYSKSLAL